MIYDGALHDTTNFSSFEYITINSCNIQHSRGKSYTVVRHAGRVDYHILYIAEGECTCLYGDRECVMTGGQFVVYPPNVKQWYSFDEGKCATTYWIHFSGNGAERILHQLGIHGGIYRAPSRDEVASCFQKMIYNHSVGTDKHQIAARGNLMEFLAALSADCAQTKVISYPAAVVKMMEYINSNWQSSLTVAGVAKAVGLSESRAAHLFKGAIGKSVHQYIMDLRISVAKEQLLNTRLTVSQISEMMGFRDALYFSRAFKSAVGVSPTAFRAKML
ncbi:MAG: helix-turn-helix domain-containing protein [Clostridia bacterium]|nr:helix-turn-helix domain-containing protein [Clostridia bacterium]